MSQDLNRILTLQICIKKVASDTLNCIINRKDVNPCSILDIRALMNGYDISKANSEICSNNFVHSDFRFFALFISKNNADSIFALLSLYTKREKENESYSQKYSIFM
jgi:hypothetical protein